MYTHKGDISTTEERTKRVRALNSKSNRKMISCSFEMLNYLNEFSSKMQLLYSPHLLVFNFSVRNLNIKIKGFIKNWIIVGPY